MSRVVINSENRITQKYKSLSHKGVDIGHAKELHDPKNEVYSNCIGEVYEIVDNQVNNPKASGAKSWGNYVYVKHPNGMFTRYAHLETGIKVKKGQKVDENTMLGYIGNTGRSTARHLHFEVSKAYSSSKRIDPTPYLTKSVYEEGNTYTGTIPKLKKGVFAWKRGDKNVNVGYIQEFLNWLLDCNLKVDNSFGPATEAQVVVYQMNYGLQVDKRFGPACIKKMKSVKK